MQKVERRRWYTLVLIGLVLILSAGLLIQGVGLLWAWLTPDASISSNGKSPLAASCTETQHGPIVNQLLVVDEHEVICGDLTLWGGTLDVTGQVRGNILAFGSHINIVGTVSGDVNLYASTAIVRNGAHVRGNVNLFGGNERLEAGAHQDGAVNDQSQHVSFWLPGLSAGFAFPFWPMIIWVVFGLALISLLPEHVMFVRTTVANKTRRSFLLGFLSFLLAPTVLLVLIALILPIPLAIAIAIGLIAAWALGTIAVGWLVGEYIMRAIAPRYNTRPAQVTVGLTILVLVGSLPYIGWLVSIGAGLLGLGAVFLSRFGTRLYSQPRHPLKF
jgi:hypothetical protein